LANLPAEPAVDGPAADEQPVEASGGDELAARRARRRAG
jgi:hypothetical protein